MPYMYVKHYPGMLSSSRLIAKDYPTGADANMNGPRVNGQLPISQIMSGTAITRNFTHSWSYQ